jgi:hypothetical protein
LPTDVSGGFPVGSIELRNAAQLSEPLNRQLSQYALAAGTAGLGLLALAQPGEAKVVYTKTHEVIHGEGGSHGTLYLDLNHDGQTDFNFYIGGASNGSFLVVERPYTSKSGRNLISTSPSNAAVAFPAGARIGPGGKSKPWAFMEGNTFRTKTSSGGNWLNVKNRYLGLLFKIKGKTHYGWARLSASSPPVRATLTGYAYETVPNKPIITGKTKGRDLITVQPATLGYLARGAAWRVKQTAATH